MIDIKIYTSILSKKTNKIAKPVNLIELQVLVLQEEFVINITPQLSTPQLSTAIHCPLSIVHCYIILIES